MWCGHGDKVGGLQPTYGAAGGVEQRPDGVSCHEAAHAVSNDADVGEPWPCCSHHAPHLISQALAACINALVGAEPAGHSYE